MKLGGLDISTVKLGANQVQAVYQGVDLVWQNAPVATAATGVGQTSFTANWNAYTGAVVYLLDVSESSDFSTFVYEDQQVNAPTTSYVVIGLNPNTTYYYRVRASTEALTDPDAQAFFDRVTTAGGSLSTTEQDAVNTLVVQMKDDGIWTKMKAVYPMVGASAAACAQNLKSSSFTGTFSSGWTFASTGVTPNGSSAYFDTNLNTLSNLTKTSTHLSIYIRINSNSGQPYDMGNSSNFGATSEPTYLITRYLSNNAFIGIADTSYSTSIASTDSTGFWCGATNGSSTQTLYKNGSSIKTGTAASGGFANNNLYIGAHNGGGTAQLFSNKQNAFASIGDGLTDDEALDFYNAVQAFNTTLSREI
jgi:hypothetical protein